MNRQVVLHLPDSLYETIVQKAGTSGKTLEEWIESRLLPTPDKDTRLRRHFGSIYLPEAVNKDNQTIDFELAESYAASHEEAK